MDTIKSSQEISRIFSAGRRQANRYASFIFTKAGAEASKHSKECEHGPCGRVAFIAGKKLGGAVWRNSAKRRLREIYRANSSKLGGFDILFVARGSIMDESYSKVLTTCEQTLKKITHEDM